MDSLFSKFFKSSFYAFVGHKLGLHLKPGQSEWCAINSIQMQIQMEIQIEIQKTQKIQIQKPGSHSNATVGLVRVRGMELILLPLHNYIYYCPCTNSLQLQTPNFCTEQTSRLSDLLIAGNHFLQTLDWGQERLNMFTFHSGQHINRNFWPQYKRMKTMIVARIFGRYIKKVIEKTLTHRISIQIVWS